MIIFLKSDLGVNVKILCKMSYKNLVDLYTKEIRTLQGDFERREAVEKKVKARHDTHIEKPFPEEKEEEVAEKEDAEKEVDTGATQIETDAELAKKL